jgi:glutamate synthase domain-containing protein 2
MLICVEVIAGLLGVFLVGLGIYEAFIQRNSTLRRNFPLVIHFRYWLEELGAPLRQYIISADTVERPYSRNVRSWVYASAKGENNVIGFGSQVDHNAAGTIHLLPSMFPINHENHAQEEQALPPVIGKNSRNPYQPKSFFNISGMSFGALSANAVRALSRGAKLADVYMSTGEGGLSPYHEEGGGDLVFQIGPAKFGCRTPDGRLDEEKLLKITNKPQVKMIEIKLAQGAKPGKGGVLPKAKITPEIAQIRGIPMDKDCHSPNSHAEFNDSKGLLEFVARVQKLTGKPTGIKLVGGTRLEADELAKTIQRTGIVPDFIIVDGTEGGSGAAPLALADYVGLPLREGLTQMDNALRKYGVRDQTVVIASGRIATGGDVVQALALGADMVNIARGFLLSLGCIQAMRCQTNNCPTGIATQKWWLQRGLDPTDKSLRAANYAKTLKKDVFMILHSCGLTHPKQLTRDHLTMVVAPGQTRTMRELYPYPNDAEAILSENWNSIEAGANTRRNAS